MRSDAAPRCCCSAPATATPKAVPLGLVARLEEIAARARSRSSGGTPVVQYRGQLMPLIAGRRPAGCAPEGAARQPVLVFTDGDRAMGLMVDEIVDIVEDRLKIELGRGAPGFLGSAIDRRPGDRGDRHRLLAAPGRSRTGSARAPTATAQRRPARVLLVDDSAFFRNLLAPALVGRRLRGDGGRRAPPRRCALREAGDDFDVIVSDIEMPGMDGFAFAAAVRAGGAWASLPMVALSPRAEPADVARGREVGFTDYVAKFDRDALLQSPARTACRAGRGLRETHDAT